MFFCDPIKNKDCTQTGCLFYMTGECFSTTHEEFAIRLIDGSPAYFPEEDYEKAKAYITEKWIEHISEAMYRDLLFGQVKKVKAPGKVES